MAKKELKKKFKEVVCSRSKAYIYLKGLIEVSQDFKGKIENLRANLGIDLNAGKNLPWHKIKPLKKMYSEKGKKKLSLKEAAELKMFAKAAVRLEAYLRAPQLSENKEFIDICEEYYLPKDFWHGLEIFIFTGNAEKLLNNKIKTVSMRGKTAPIKQDNFLVPHIVLYLPIDASKEEFKASWKDVKATCALTNGYWLKNREWKHGETFDKAFKAYKIFQEQPSEKTLKNKLLESKKYERESMIDTKDAYNSIKRIGEQIESLKKWRILGY